VKPSATQTDGSVHNTTDTVEPGSWKILVVDDDIEVHKLTHFVLSGFTYENRPLQLIEAHTCESAIKILTSNSDISLVLLDVVMETDYAGLELVKYIREELHNHLIQIVLRTGQPGQAPEFEVFAKYDINDYKEKTELTVTRLFSTVMSSLRAYKLSKSLQDSVDQLEQRVAVRTSELELANEELESFVHTVSHELRSPLCSIRGFTSILVEDYAEQMPDEAQDCLRRIAGNASRMESLLTGLLEFSRYASRLPQNEKVDLGRLANQAVESLADQALLSGAKIDVLYLPSCLGDAILLRQVFINLISNAIKFSSKSENPRIEVGTRVEDGNNVIYVKDNGIGFDEEQKAHLFKLFSRLHDEHSFKGSGVGLALVERIVRRHGGKIWAESSSDKGTVFLFTLDLDGRS
jgi:signal transduction histidine kinase